MVRPRIAPLTAPLLLGLLLALGPVSAAAATGPSVRGGGVVDGPVGTTSQLGFTATSAGGRFLCVMAGRSGGFPFGQWTSLRQMLVQGRVTPGTLVITGGVATFKGLATIHLVGRTASGLAAATLDNVSFVSTQRAGGAGVGWHRLDLPGLPPIGPAFLRSGRITISP